MRHEFTQIGNSSVFVVEMSSMMYKANHGIAQIMIKISYISDGLHQFSLKLNRKPTALNGKKHNGKKVICNEFAT